MTSHLIFFGELYTIYQNNGQKIAELSKLSQTTKSVISDVKFLDNKEIFLPKIPRELTIEEILPIFASIGPIYRFRLMMNFSGQNRGFAFLQYVDDENYFRVFSLLQGKSYGRYVITIQKSKNCRTLIFGKIPKYILSIVIRNLQEEFNLINYYVYSENDEMFGNLLFTTHRQAALGRRRFLEIFAHMQESNSYTNAYVKWEK